MTRRKVGTVEPFSAVLLQLTVLKTAPFERVVGARCQADNIVINRCERIEKPVLAQTALQTLEKAWHLLVKQCQLNEPS